MPLKRSPGSPALARGELLSLVPAAHAPGAVEAGLLGAPFAASWAKNWRTHLAGCETQQQPI